MNNRITFFLCVAILSFGCQSKNKDTSSQSEKENSETILPETSKPILPNDTINTNKDNTKDMVSFDGGEITIGSMQGSNRHQPVFIAEIEPFYIDKLPVTVAAFSDFVKITGYITEAEKFGDSGIFDFKSGTWNLLKGTSWKFPLGPDHPEAEPSHPVTHISWNDAMVFAEWAGKRLPSEFEWEYAARNGKNSGEMFPWGNQEIVNGKYMANTFQGDSPTAPSPRDGYLYTSPAGIFGEHPSGLYDMSGNVWQWCSNTFMPYPESSFRTQVNESVKSIRGGSFMYDELGVESYSVYGRSFNSIETSLFNLGFRCAMDK